MRSRNRRLLAWSTAVNALGNGAYLPFSLVLLTKLTGLPLTQVGVTMTAAALLALALMPLMGTLIDRFGPRRALVVAHLLRAVAFAAFPALHSLGAFAAAAVLSALTERVARIAQPALIGETAEAAQTDRLVALTRSLNNAGMGLGGLAAALLAASDTPGTYLAAAWFNAATFVAAAGMVAAIKSGRPSSQRARTTDPDEPVAYRQLLRQPTFALLVCSTALAAFGYSALTIFLPLYALRLEAPAWTSGALFSLNTALCALAGVPVAAAATRRASRASVARLGLLLMATAFAIFAAAGAAADLGPLLPVAALTAAMVVYTTGELLHAPMSTALALAQAPPAHRGRYMALNQMAWALAGALAPAVFTTLLRWHLTSAPMVVGGLDLLAVAALAAMTRSVRPRRPAEPVAPLLTAPVPACAAPAAPLTSAASAQPCARTEGTA